VNGTCWLSFGSWGSTHAQELNIAEAARAMGADVATVRSDLALFEKVYLVHHLPAWSRKLTAKIKKRPKIHLVDSGFAACSRPLPFGDRMTALPISLLWGGGPALE
jgi:predicted AAA+ superfamily ATPase